MLVCVWRFCCCFHIALSREKSEGEREHKHVDEGGEGDQTNGVREGGNGERE